MASNLSRALRHEQHVKVLPNWTENLVYLGLSKQSSHSHAEPVQLRKEKHDHLDFSSLPLFVCQATKIKFSSAAVCNETEK